MTKNIPPWTRQGRFLRALAKTGCVAASARAAGLDKRTAYRWRDRDRDFARRWTEALYRATERLRDEAMERALVGRERNVYRYRPTAAHRAVRREMLGRRLAAVASPPSGPPPVDLAARLRQAEARMTRYHAERAAKFPDTDFE